MKAIVIIIVSLSFMVSCNLNKEIKIVDVDCSNLGEVLDSMYIKDQAVRKNGNAGSIDLELMRKIDHENLKMTVSILEKCGMPTSNEYSQDQIETIWIVIQHSDIKYQKKYFPLLKESGLKGDLSLDLIAMMEDRMLMYEGKPQVYGSQITKDENNNNWILYNLESPESVDKRRKEVGLEPLNEYLKNWDIEFNIEQQ